MAANTAAIKKVMDMIKKHDVKMIDFRFTDLPGQWQHFSIPAGTFEEKMFTGVTGTHVIRVLPPLTLTKKDASHFLEKLSSVLKNM